MRTIIEITPPPPPTEKFELIYQGRCCGEIAKNGNRQYVKNYCTQNTHDFCNVFKSVLNWIIVGNNIICLRCQECKNYTKGIRK